MGTLAIALVGTHLCKNLTDTLQVPFLDESYVQNDRLYRYLLDIMDSNNS